MIKVLHVLSSSSYSGAENAVIELIANLNEDFQGIYCSRTGDIEDWLEKKEVKYILLDDISRSNLKNVLEDFQPDIIHAHDFKASLKMASIKTNARLISHLHHNPPWIRKINLKTFLYTSFSYRFDKIFVVSDAIREEFKTLKKVKEKMVNVHNPINVDRILELSMETESDLKSDIVFVGRLTEAKGIPLLLKIYAQLINEIPNLQIYVIGKGELENDVINGIKELKIENNVTMLGYKSNPYPYMKASKLMIMPSNWEGFGLSAAESMLLGTPVIATPVGGLQEVVGNENGLVCDKLECFVEKSLELLEDESYYTKVSEDVSDRVNERYNLKNYLVIIEQEYYDIYDKSKN